MEQAKARNPTIKLYALAWGAPGWIGNGTFFSTDMINYYRQLARLREEQPRSDHRLPRRLERARLQQDLVREASRSTLNSRGYSAVQIVADDTSWAIADDRGQRPRLRRRRQIVGAHYPCGYRRSASDLPELGQRGRLRQDAVGQRERLGRLQRRRRRAGPRHQPRLHRRQDDRRTSTGRSIAAITRTCPFPTDGLSLATSRGPAPTRSARTPG